MKEINEQIKKYLENIIYIQNFVINNWGHNGILERKNCSEIPNSDFSIKNSLIKGYSFHGYGCLFKFKNYNIDIEFLNDRVAFTLWNIKSFLKIHKKNIDDNEIIDNLTLLTNKGILEKINNHYVIRSQ